MDLSEVRSARRRIANSTRKRRREARKLRAPVQLGRMPVYVELGGRALPGSSDDEDVEDELMS